MKDVELWEESDIVQLISNKIEESLTLDFKRADSLQQSDGKKSEISKDVSAFANSVGGTIIYGLEESPDPPHVASAISPIDPSKVSKEWLEQVIGSRIQPRILGVKIKPIELSSSSPGQFAYVVAIPESHTAHQASDKRYYRRFNFESVPMEDYEVRLTMNRASRPNYSVKLEASRSEQDNVVTLGFRALVQNESEIVGRDVSVVLFAPKHVVSQPDDHEIEVDDTHFSRIVADFVESSRVTRSAIQAQPLVPYSFRFTKDVVVPLQLEPSPPLVTFVNVYDQFGLALRARFHVFLPEGRIRLKTAEQVGRRF